MDIETNASNSKKTRDRIFLMIAVFATFLIYGFYENVKGPALPRMQADLNISELQLGVLLAVNSLAYLFACSFTTTLAKKLSMKTCLIFSLLVVAVSGVCICFSPSYTILLLSYFVLHFGNGMLEISQGVIAAKIFTKNTGAMMNLAHFFYGAGSIFSPVISTSLMVARFGSVILGWRYLYLIVLSWALIPIIPALFGRLDKQEHKENKTSFVTVLKNRTLWLLVLVLALGSICEMGVAAWLVNFLEKAYAFSSEKAALQLTLFFVCLTLSRLILGPLIDKAGLINSLAFFTAFSGVAITIGILCGEPGTILLVITGIGVAPVYPTVMAVAAKLFSETINHAITAIMMIMGVLIIVYNLLLGSIVQFARTVLTATHGEKGVGMAYASGFLFLGLCCFGAFVFALILKSKQKKAGRPV